MSKAQKLEKIAKEIENCKVCRVGKSGKAVPGEGSADADIVFIGEAPGKTEAATGRPFVGRSGQFLRSMIRRIGLKEEDVFITSPVKYLPRRTRVKAGLPDRGTPSSADIAHGRVHLLKQLEVINPKIIVLLGSVAAQGVLGEKFATTKMHGKTIEKEDPSRVGEPRRMRRYFFTFHPAAGIRFPPIKKLIEQDFGKLKNLI